MEAASWSSSSPDAKVFWVGWTLGLVAIGLFLVLVRRNFLRVASTRELSFVMLVVAVPCLAVTTEEYALGHFKEMPFFSRRGAEIVGILLVAAALPWIDKVLEFAVSWLLVWNLRTIEHNVHHVLESIVDMEMEADRRAAVTGMLEGVGVKEYAVYVRGREGVFERHLNEMRKPTRQKLPISPQLRGFLGRQRSFLDLQSVPFEWPYFFQQFELYRIELATSARYLLPLCLGESVQGLLLLPDGETEEDICKDPAAKDLGNLGVAAIRIEPARPPKLSP